MSRSPPDSTPLPLPHDCAGLILAGGQGRRMNGADKGLLPWRGRPLIEHVIERFAPQVEELWICANRNLDRYAAFGASIVSDEPGTQAFRGPLAGIVAAMRVCRRRWLAVVPCDAPMLPLDLVARLALGRGTQQAAAATAAGRTEPLFCLLSSMLAPALAARLARGQGGVLDSLADSQAALVPFADTDAFANINTPEDLQALHERS